LLRKLLVWVAPPSMKITDWPAPMVETPFSASDEPNALELSSTRQPETSTDKEPTLVSSNQSAPTTELPLLQGATSVIRTCAVAAVAVRTNADKRAESGSEERSDMETFVEVEEVAWRNHHARLQR